MKRAVPGSMAVASVAAPAAAGRSESCCAPATFSHPVGDVCQSSFASSPLAALLFPPGSARASLTGRLLGPDHHAGRDAGGADGFITLPVPARGSLGDVSSRAFKEREGWGELGQCVEPIPGSHLSSVIWINPDIWTSSAVVLQRGGWGHPFPQQLAGRFNRLQKEKNKCWVEIPPPPCPLMAVHLFRLFNDGSFNALAVRESAHVTPGSPAERRPDPAAVRCGVAPCLVQEGGSSAHPWGGHS